MNDFQLSETDKCIEAAYLGLFQTHIDNLGNVLHGFIDGLASGVTTL